MKFNLANQDQRVMELIPSTDQKLLARWALLCAYRVLPMFEDKYPSDHRPREALVACEAWLKGELKMWDARKFCYPALAAAREIEATDLVGCAVARACSHALATVHVKRHCYGAANYGLLALIRQNPNEEETIIKKEREWQFNTLLNLIGSEEKFI